MKLNNSQIRKLKNSILKEMDKVDDSLHIEDFAQVVSLIFNDEYGSHNKKMFFDKLKKEIRWNHYQRPQMQN